MSRSEPELPSTYRLVCYDRIDSTNEEAKRQARDGAVDRTLVWAHEQTKGRGRQGRVWSSPPGNLYVSLILRPHCPLARVAQLGFVAAVAVGDTLGSICNGRLDGLSYKWPNDVLLRGRKIAGILLESELGKGQAPEFVILGVGINLVSSPHSSEFLATSIAEEDFGAVSPAAALTGFARHFEAWSERWRKEGFAPIRAAWLAHAMSLGQSIRVRLETVTLHGRFLNIDQHGTLLLESAGKLRRVFAGEVFPANR
jgi:BirA family biotin operon repressor/biotin-[acetyl-CoA-carboxylase] ligase